MKNPWKLSKKQLIGALAFAAVFPVSNLMGGTTMLIGIVLSIPFLPLAWIGGMGVVWAVQNEQGYLIGAALTIFMQIYAVMTLWNWARRDQHATNA